ncbi:hydrolase [Saccharomonospora sp. NPDC006951]
MSFWICRTCAVEHAEASGTCAICADERQWVPSTGQQWTTLAELADEGRRTEITQLEPGLSAITSNPHVGIGQYAKLLTTPAGSLLWDPIGFLDKAAVDAILELGPVVAVAASHPHMFGVQVEWSKAFGNVPVFVSEPDLEWVARPDPVITPWKDTVEVLPGVTMTQLGGHFPGSSVVHWAGGADGKGVLLSSDTIFANPDRTSVSFMRSFPNRIPLSGAVVERVTSAVENFAFDRLYANFGNIIDSDAREVVRRSADRHIGWVRGDFDHLT